MVRAGILLFATMIMLLIAILTSSLLAYKMLSDKEFLSYQRKERLLRNASSGIELLKVRAVSAISSTSEKLDLFGDGDDSVELITKPWGLFEIGISTAFTKRNSYTKMALMGYPIQDNKSYALYLVDQKKPLRLCGKTFIKGECYLPYGTVKRGYIEGSSFQGKVLIDGKIKRSSKQLPSINIKVLQYHLNILSGEGREASENYPGIRGDSLNSFRNHTAILFSEEDMSLDDISLRGNIIVVVQGLVTISAQAHLQNIVIYARSIRVENEFSGTLQLIASDFIRIGEAVHLSYPSALALLQAANEKSTPVILIGNRSIIEGVVLLHKHSRRAVLKLLPQATIVGEVYVNGDVDLKGKIAGSLACHSFLLRTPSAFYENQLLDATIDYSALPKGFVASILSSNSYAKEIVQWLY